MQYLQAICSGKGFITAQDRMRFSVSGYPADVWVLDENHHGQRWAEEKIRFNEGQFLTQSEAQALINAECADSVDEDGNPIEPPILP